MMHPRGPDSELLDLEPILILSRIELEVHLQPWVLRDCAWDATNKSQKIRMAGVAFLNWVLTPHNTMHYNFASFARLFFGQLIDQIVGHLHIRRIIACSLSVDGVLLLSDFFFGGEGGGGWFPSDAADRRTLFPFLKNAL